ncbi:MAG: class I SAM-dependent methyltransferase [Halioglobus sp.]
MIEKIQRQWETLGNQDPYWAVLSDHSKMGGKWSKEEFFATGEIEIDAALRKTRDLGIKLKYSAALDFGCGVGRLSRAISERFEQVSSVDISKTMLNHAKEANSDKKNIKYILNTRSDLSIIPSNSVDFLYSNIVLQHIPSGLQKSYIQEFCRVLNTGGVMVIQTPSHINTQTWQGWAFKFLGNRILNFLRRFIYGGASGVMEIYLLPQDEVLRLIKDEGLIIMGVEHNFSTGVALNSYNYTAQK